MSLPPTTPEPPPAADNLRLPALSLSKWFTEEVHAHDGQLKSYLRGSFPTVRDVDDLVQESYLRIWKAHAAHPIQSAKAFLFRIARNVALDLVRRNRNSPIDAVGDLRALNVVEDARSVVDAVSIEEKLNLLAAAIAMLPPRSREIIMLCKIQGLTHREAAARLGLAEKTVDEHILRGFKRLDAELRSKGVTGLFG